VNAILLAAFMALAQAASPLVDPAPFSAMKPGDPLPAGWTPLTLPKVAAPQVALVADEGATVLRSIAEASAGTVSHPLGHDVAARPMLRWRWKVDRVVEKADLATKAGDDFAARVYVFFDVPAESLPVAHRLKVFLARNLYGREVPTAALCYVWDNRHPPGTTRWNPYTDRVRTVVLRSGGAGAWAAESRDLEADFREAFGAGWAGPVPRVTGIAAGNDTDQTGERVTAWFGDFRLERRP
jgi:Protein of unknown function (DUF3047)